MNDWALRKSWIYNNPMKSESSRPGPLSSHHDGESNRIQEEHDMETALTSLNKDPCGETDTGLFVWELKSVSI